MHRGHSFLFVLSFLILLPLTGFAASKGSNPNGKPFIELEGQIIEVEGEIASLQDQIDTLVARVDSVEQRLLADQDAIAELQARNSDLELLLSSYGSDISAIEGEVIRLQGENVLLQQYVDQGDLTLLSQIEANESMITTLNQSLADMGNLEAQIQNNLDLITALQNEIESIHALLDMKQNIVNGSCPAGYSIYEIRPDGSVGCEYDDIGGGGGTTAQQLYYQNFYPIAAQGRIQRANLCPEGWWAVNSGFWGELNIRFYGLSVIGNSGMFAAHNPNNFDTYVYHFLTCMKFQ